MQNSGDPGEASEGASPFAPVSAADALEIGLIRSLVVATDPVTREQLLRLSRRRGHDVVVLEGPDFDSGDALQPVELALVELAEGPVAAHEGFIRCLLRLFRDEGIVVVGAIAAGSDDAQLTRWLEIGVNDFLRPEDAHADVQLLAAEQCVRRNRARIEAQKHATASLRRFELLFLNSPDAQIIMTPRDNRILDACLRVQDVLGWRREELIGRYLSLVLPDLFRKKDLVEAGELAVDSKQPVSVSDVACRRPDGSQCLLDARVAAVPWGCDEALMVTFFDVTIPRARQERRVRSAKLDTVGCMATGVADDVSNVLTAVRGNLSLIGAQSTLNHAARELLRDAECACASADKLVGQLRTLSRSDSGASRNASGASNRRRRLNLGAFLRRVISFELLGSRVVPTFEVDDSLWKVEVDEGQLELALQALVANASDAMPSGGHLRVLAANYEPPATPSGSLRSYVLLSLVDDGHGIPRELVGKVFDPYFSTRPDRAGLGLAISQAIVRSHGGIIDLERGPVRGTAVRIYLPAAAEAEREEVEPGVPAISAPGAPEDFVPRRRILVMDDDKDIRVILRKILASHGFDVYCVSDGREAIDVFHKAHQMKAPFDVALFDLDVRGGMGGKDAVARLRRDFPAIKVILMTGFVDDVLLENHQEHGFSGVITKPFHIDKLIATITQLAGASNRNA